MERLFKIKDDNRILILDSDDIIYRDGKLYVVMRSLANTNFKDDIVPHINIEYKEVEEVAIYQMDNGEYVITKKFEGDD